MKSLFAPSGILLAASLLIISSISTRLFGLQIIWILIGIGVIFVFHYVDLRSFLNYRWLIGGIYVLAIFLLIAAHFTAPIIRNTKSWLVLGSLNYQPVELVKVALILTYAAYFSRRHLTIARWKNILTSFLFFIIPAALVAVQPDMGSALILFGIWFGFLLVSGLPFRRLMVSIFIFVILGFAGWHYVLKDYQRDRITGVFYPEKYALTTNYSVIQSKIAIGSAGFFGKGYKQGTQIQLGFLSEPANDFVLAAFIEEWGIFGGFLVIGAFVFLIISILRIGILTDHNFEKFICLGAAIVFGMHFLFNAGSSAGIFPVVGVTFPFISYGGSSLLTDFFLLGMINAIGKRF